MLRATLQNCCKVLKKRILTEKLFTTKYYYYCYVLIVGACFHKYLTSPEIYSCTHSFTK